METPFSAENVFPFMDNDPNSNCSTFEKVRDEVYTNIRAMGNSNILLRQVEDVIRELIVSLCFPLVF